MNRGNCIIKNANTFTRFEIGKFKEIVLSKGEVSEMTFDGLMDKNPILLFYPNTNEIEAIGALKIPYDQYKSKVFRKSKTQLNPSDFKYELGWVVSLNKGKGIGKSITNILSQHKSKIYATVRSENIGMNKIMNSIGLIKEGIEYESERGNYLNILYIKDKL